MEPKGYFNKELCDGCGKCCIQGGCGYLPSDFEKMSYGYLKSKLEEGNIAIEARIKPEVFNGEYVWYPILALRSMNQDREIVDLLSYRTPCALLKDNGCIYSDDDRPSLGRYLKPLEDGACKQMLDQEYVEKQWLKYQDTLSGLVKYFSGKTVEEKILEDIENLKTDMIRKYPKSFRLKFNGDIRYINSGEELDDETLDLLDILIVTQSTKLKRRKIK